MCEREMCVTADKTCIFHKSVMNTRTIKIKRYQMVSPFSLSLWERVDSKASVPRIKRQRDPKVKMP